MHLKIMPKLNMLRNQVITIFRVILLRNDAYRVIINENICIFSLIPKRFKDVGSKIINLIVYDINHTIWVIRIVDVLRFLLNSTDKCMESDVQHTLRIYDTYLCTVAVQHGKIEHGINHQFIIHLCKIVLKCQRLNHV